MMKQVFFNNKKSIKRHRRLCVLSIILIIILNNISTSDVQAQSYKQNTGYLFQKVEHLTHYYFIPLRHGLIMPYFFGYYIVDDETLLDYFRQDTVILEKAIMLCDPTNEMFADSAIVKDVKRFTRLMDVLSLDDSEIYRIGQDMYIIRKIKYAYYDNSQVKVYIRNSAAYLWDDLTEDELLIVNEKVDVGQFYERDYYECYHHLIEILPTPPQISKHSWKRLYQFGEETSENDLNPCKCPR